MKLDWRRQDRFHCSTRLGSYTSARFLPARERQSHLFFQEDEFVLFHSNVRQLCLRLLQAGPESSPPAAQGSTQLLLIRFGPGTELKGSYITSNIPR